MEAQSVGGGWSGVATGYPLVLEQTWWCLFVCVFLTDIRELRPGQWDERALYTSIFLSFFFSFLVCVRQSFRPSVLFSVINLPIIPCPIFRFAYLYIFSFFFRHPHDWPTQYA